MLFLSSARCVARIAPALPAPTRIVGYKKIVALKKMNKVTILFKLNQFCFNPN